MNAGGEAQSLVEQLLHITCGAVACSSPNMKHCQVRLGRW